MRKLFTLLLAVLASAGTAFASDTQVDGIWYDFDSSTKTASVTYRGSSYSYDEYSGSVVIPSSVTYNSVTYSVTSIGGWAFRECTGLTSVTIPNSVTSIGVGAFYNCSGLASVIWNAKNCADFASNNTPFYDLRSQITSFTFGNEVEHIPAYLCNGMSNLTSVTIPNSVTSIGSGAFYGCTGLTSVVWNAKNCSNSGGFGSQVESFVFGSEVEKIPAFCCNGMSNLTSIEIPNSVTSIGEKAFSSCSGLTSPVFNAHVFAFMPTSYSGAYTIPDGIESITDDAFSGCSGLTSVTIPNSVTSIGSSAFSGCSGLTSVTIPNSVTSIGDWAFQSCTGLTSVTIPGSVTSIGVGAFYNCSSLISVIWNAKNCADFASNNTPFYYYDYYFQFDLRPQITSFTFGNEVEHIPAYLCDGMSNLTSIEIPNSVTSIGGWAFEGCSGLTSVTIPNSVTSIGSSAFSYCSSLTSVTIPTSVTSIGGSAFSECTGLTSVTIGNSVTSIGGSAFYGCSGLASVIWNAKNCADFASNNTPCYDLRSQITSFTFGNEVEHIPAYLCNGMSNLTSIEIPNSVTSIGDYAFQRCSGLTSLTIGNSVTSIGKYAFYGCSGLTSLTIGNSVTSIGKYAFYGCSGLTSVTIPNSVTSIGGYAFQRCSGLTSLTIGNSVTSIDNYAFIECSGLTSVEGPAVFFDRQEDLWPYYTRTLNHVTVNGGELTENALLFINRSYKTLQTLDVSGVTNTEFADEAFKGYYNLQQLVLPEGLQKVSYMMVAGCKNLQSIDIPASVEEIEQSAFEDCRSLKSITFGGSPAGAPGRFNAPAASASLLKKIGNWAFYNAHELQNLEIPEGVTEIGDGAFYGCTYLEDLVLPSSVRAIGDNCFALCAKLTKIVVNSTTPPEIEAKTFYDVKRQIPVYVPDEAVSAYEADTYWQEFDIQGASKMPTGISDVQGNNVQCTKVVRNGQVFILRGEKIYTLTGQEVK